MNPIVLTICFPRDAGGSQQPLVGRLPSATLPVAAIASNLSHYRQARRAQAHCPELACSSELGQRGTALRPHSKPNLAPITNPAKAQRCSGLVGVPARLSASSRSRQRPEHSSPVCSAAQPQNSRLLLPLNSRTGPWVNRA